MKEDNARRQRAQQAAEACARVLKEQFGAREVYIFGSLAGQGPWHSRSATCPDTLTATSWNGTNSACSSRGWRKRWIGCVSKLSGSSSRWSRPGVATDLLPCCVSGDLLRSKMIAQAEDAMMGA